jgi:two-component system KDP operon response regulator KdpE
VTVRERILVVDDEPQIRRFLRPSLEAAGYDIEVATNAAQALHDIASHMPDLIVLDLGLPDMDGKSVILHARESSDVPIIVLSARDQESEKIAALDLGANDYVAKPFGIGELLARIRASLRSRRLQSGEVSELLIGKLRIDFAVRRVSLDGRPVALTPKEFDVLAILARNVGRVVTHRQLLEAVWGPAHLQDTQYLRVFVGQLRAKIEANASEPAFIVTEPGVGYRLAEDEGRA